MPNNKYRHQEEQRQCMSQTTRSSFTPLPLINKAITDSQRHNYAVITQNNRFSLTTFQACFTRVPPQITTTTTPHSPTVNPPALHKHVHMYSKGYSWECELFLFLSISLSLTNTHTQESPPLSLPELVSFSNQIVSWQHTRQSPPM